MPKAFKYIIMFLTSIVAFQPAMADEVFVGIAAHEVNTPFTFDIEEGGADFQVGYRGDKIEALSFIGKPSPHFFVSINTAGETSLFVTGLSWKFGKKVFVRPGIGLAVHTGPSFLQDADGRRIDLGSRILFEPELGVGVVLSDKVDLEASWVHVSHARLFNSEQNPGLDVIGLRLNLKFP